VSSLPERIKYFISGIGDIIIHNEWDKWNVPKPFFLQGKPVRSIRFEKNQSQNLMTVFAESQYVREDDYYKNRRRKKKIRALKKQVKKIAFRSPQKQKAIIGKLRHYRHHDLQVFQLYQTWLLNQKRGGDPWHPLCYQYRINLDYVFGDASRA